MIAGRNFAARSAGLSEQSPFPSIPRSTRQLAPSLASVLLAAVLFGGFLDIPRSPGETSIKTLLVDACVFALTVAGIVHLLHARAVKLPSWTLAWLALLALYLVRATDGGEPLWARFLVIRSNAIYPVVGIVAGLILSNESLLLRARRLLMNGSAILAAFAIIQVAARRKLSPALLIPISDDAFGYWDSDIIRANGLTGNPIVFGTIMSLCYCLHLARSVSYPTLKNFALAALVFGGLLASLSRAAMLIALAATFLIPLVALRKTRPSTPLLSLFLPALGLIAALVGIQSNVGRGSFLLSEIMFGANRAVQNSTQGHLRMIRAGIDSLSESTLFGSGIGTQVSDSNWAQVSGNEVITDGLFWSMASEGGFLLAAAYFVMLTLAGLDSCRCWRRPARDYMALGFAIFTACQVCLVIFLNSGLLGKSAAIIYWFTAGLVGAHGRLSVAHYSSVANSPITRRWGSAV